MSKSTGGSPVETALVTSRGDSGLAIVDEEKLRERAVMYLDSIGCTVTESQKYQFLDICQVYGLNPFLREIYAVPYKGKMSIIVGYEVYLKRGERSGLLKGWKVWVEGTGDNMIAKIEIKRHGWDDPFTHEVYFREYAQYKFDSQTRKWVLTKFWKSKPVTMLKKVAIAQGFRLAFPDHCGTMPYTIEEGTHDNSIDAGEVTEGQDIEQPVGTFLQQEKSLGEQSGEVVTDTAQEPAQVPEQETAQQPVQQEPVAQPVQAAGAADIDLLRVKLLARVAPMGADFGRFLVAKGWIKAGKNVVAITDNQVERLVQNYDALMGIYNVWISENGASQ